MNRSRNYRGFTLVEMLVVMGILVILMTMGIAAGRFAIQRANRVQHQNAADQIFQALQSYYADNRVYPATAEMTSFGTAMSSGALSKYLDSEGFDGGSDATFYYMTDDGAGNQSMLVCVSYSANNDENNQGGYCNGNGFGDLPTTGTKVTTKVMDGDAFDIVSGVVTGSDWDGKAKSW